MKRYPILAMGFMTLLAIITPPAQAGERIVQSGDVMSKMFGDNWHAVCDANKAAGRVADCDEIYPGQKLIVPSEATSAAAPPPKAKAKAAETGSSDHQYTAPMEIDVRGRRTWEGGGIRQDKVVAEVTQWECKENPNGKDCVGGAVEVGGRENNWETERSYGTSSERSIGARVRNRQYHKECSWWKFWDSCRTDQSVGVLGAKRESEWTSKRSGKSGVSPESYVAVTADAEFTGYKGPWTGKAGVGGRLQVATDSPDKNMSGIGVRAEVRHQVTKSFGVYGRVDHWMSNGNTPFTTPEAGVRFGGTENRPAVQIGVGKTIQTGATMVVARVNSGPFDGKARLNQHQDVGTGAEAIVADKAKTSASTKLAKASAKAKRVQPHIPEPDVANAFGAWAS